MNQKLIYNSINIQPNMVVIPTDRPPDQLPKVNSNFIKAIPINKHTNIKISFKKLQKKNIDYNILNGAFIRTNRLVTRGYLFIKSYILYCIDQEIPLQIIDFSFVKMALKALSVKQKGGAGLGETNVITYNKLLEFYDTYFSKQLGFNKVEVDKISATNLSSILDASIEEMVTCINNNITLNFYKRVNQFVNQMFKKENEDILLTLTGKVKEAMNKKLKNDLRIVKNCLIEKKFLPAELDVKYRQWTLKYRKRILPEQFFSKCDSYTEDVKNHPQLYFPYLIEMNRILEEFNLKQFSILPIRTSMVPKHIHIDTKAIVELYCIGHKGEYTNNIRDNQELIWKQFFNLSDTGIFKKSPYKMKHFNYHISTNMYDVSIQFIHTNFLEQSNNKKDNMKNKKAAKAFRLKGLTKEEQQIEKEKIKNENNEKTKKYNAECAIKQQKFKKYLETLSDEERDRVIENQRRYDIEHGKTPYNEFQYFDKLTGTELEHFKQSKENIIVCDPNKRTLLAFSDMKGVRFNYTNKARLHNTKRLLYQDRILKFKNKNNMIPIESALSFFNSKTTDFNKFNEYIHSKTVVNQLLEEDYMDPIFRKLKWHTYINTKREDSMLLNRLIKFYGKDAIIVIGDWSADYNMKHFMSTKGIGLRRVLSRMRPDGSYFLVYLIDEFRTSCLNYITEKRMENIYLEDTISKKKEYKKQLKEKKEKKFIKKNKQYTTQDIINNIRDILTKERIKRIEKILTKEKPKTSQQEVVKKNLKKMHSIFTYQMGNGRYGCINRDNNSINNMVKIVNSVLETGERPYNYRRDVKEIVKKEQIPKNNTIIPQPWNAVK